MVLLVYFSAPSVYNNNNRTSRTSPRKRVMCPREGILFLRRRKAMELKKPTTYQEQLEILQNRNVVIDDPKMCEVVLERVGYYRLTAYMLPFKQIDGSYSCGTRLDTIYRIYEFDRKLRGVLISALEEVEVFLRSKFSYYHAHKYGPEGYMDPANYSQDHKSEKFQEALEREIASNRQSAFVKHHNEHYDGHFPIWVITELFTFGMLSRFYSDMQTSDKKKLAKEIYGTIPKNVTSWLRCCTDLRNICAHYGRLYYRIFPAVPANVTVDAKQISKLWGAVLALRELYPHQDKWNGEILTRLSALFEEYQADISLVHIGFPDDWENQIHK